MGKTELPGNLAGLVPDSALTAFEDRPARHHGEGERGRRTARNRKIAGRSESQSDGQSEDKTGDPIGDQASADGRTFDLGADLSAEDFEGVEPGNHLLDHLA